MRIYVFGTTTQKQKLKEDIAYDVENNMFIKAVDNVNPTKYVIPSNTKALIEILDNGTPFPEKYKTNKNYLYVEETYIRKRLVLISKQTPISEVIYATNKI